MLKNCMNPECSAVFDDKLNTSFYCVKCQAILKHEAKASELAPIGEVFFSNCVNPACQKTFESTGRSYFCPDCEQVEKKSHPLNPESKNAKVCMTPECKQIFYGISDSLLCPLCERILDKAEKESDEEIYHKIKEYLMGHQHATVDEIHVATKVPVKRIKKMLDDGKFQLVLMPKCKQCNGPIISGKPGQDMCVNCLQRMRDQLLQPFSLPPANVSKQSHRGDDGKDRKYGFGR